MQSHRNLTDTEFEKAFENQTLPPDMFTHEAHIRLGWIHIRKYGVERAIDNIISQLSAYVTALGAESKYNHTLTIAAIRAIDFMRRSRADNFEIFIQAWPRLITHFKDLMRAHYRINIFQSEQARTRYLEPDLLPFD